MPRSACPPAKIIAQLHRIEGQVRSIENMYKEKRSVEDIVRVVLAARASLDSMTRLLVTDKIKGCYDKKLVVKKAELTKLIDILFDIT